MSDDFVPMPEGMDAHLTPSEIEQHLKKLFNALASAQLGLRRLRDEEVNAKHDYESARNKALLSDECPRLSRKDGGVTADERNAWVDVKVESERFTLSVATMQRENAEDYLRMLRQQSEIVRSLGTSVRQAYEMSGRSS